MNKLIQNELIKIFKRKSTYFLFFLVFLCIVGYNLLIPNTDIRTSNINLSNYPDSLIEQWEQEIQTALTIEEQVAQKTELDIKKLFNAMPKKSWQRYVLKEENNPIGMRLPINIEQYSKKGSWKATLNNSYYQFNKNPAQVFTNTYYIVNNYEINPSANITQEEYTYAKEKLNQYISSLNTNDFEKYLHLKLQDLETQRQLSTLSQDEKTDLDAMIQVYQLRVQYQIPHRDDLLNFYLDELFSAFHYSNGIRQIAINKYLVEQNITEVGVTPVLQTNTQNARNLLINTFSHFSVLIVTIIIYLSSMTISEENNSGTIKNLFVKPHKRSHILYAKIFVCMIITLIVICFVIFIQYLVGGFVFGFSSYSTPYIDYNFHTQKVFTMNLWNYVFLIAITKLPIYFILILLCVWIATINRHTTMNIIITLLLFVVFSTFIAEWSKVPSLGIFTRFFITNNWDFSFYLFGKNHEIPEMSPIFSCFVVLVHFIFLLLLDIHSFQKKEIVN